MTTVLALALLAGATLPVAAAPPLAGPEGITLERIMADPEWIGHPPENPHWAADGRSVLYEKERTGSDVDDLWRVPLAGGDPAVVAEAELAAADAADGDWSRDRTLRADLRFGDVFVRDVRSGSLRQLTRSAAAETDPRFLAGDRSVAFWRGDGAFAVDLESGLESQLADLRLGKDPEEDKDPEGYLARQQLRLLDFVREARDDKREAREVARRRQRADPRRPPLPVFLGDEVEVVQRALSPSGRHVALVVAKKDRDPGKRDLMPVWINDTAYVTTREMRPKVGTGDGTGERLWIVDLETATRHEVDLADLPGITDDPLAALRAAAKARAEAEKKKSDDSADSGEPDQPAKPRAVATEEAVRWSPDGSRLAVHLHSLDNKDRWLVLVEPGEGGKPSLRPVHRLSDADGWINWDFNEFDWRRDGTLWFLSEESGWSQLHLHDPASGETRRLTSGDHTVSDPQPSPDGRWIYYTANAEHPGRFEIWRVEAKGGEAERITDLGGINAGHLSPDGRHLLVEHSTSTHPPELWVQETRPGAKARRLTQTVRDEFLELPWVEPQVVAVPSSHGAGVVYSRYYPAGGLGMDPGTGGDGKAVVFVHGAGYLQNAHFGWSSYFREFMFHSFLVRHGYAVLDMDYRGSAGYGRDWRTAIYRHMGSPELEDLADGVAWLVREQGIDPARVGVYGGSYGGFLTLMALFDRPGLFAAGAALRPVTDWAHYNHEYTSNILNTPELDPEAYERSSPLEFAAGLDRPLLMCAPMQDDNVLFLDVVRLAQKLIELEKTDWEVAIFPVEPHGFVRPSSWLDEYRRIFGLFERTVGREAGVR